MADLADLVVRLSAETSQYTAAIQKATEQIGSFADKVGDSIRDVAKDLLGLEALKEAFDFTESIVKSIASFDQLSHSVGVTTETLSQLSFAGKLSGVDDITASLEHLARSAGQALEGNQKLQSTYAALGVSITDSNGKLKSSDQLLLDVADAVSKYNDGLTKTAAVQQLLGRSGASDIKFLDQGSAGIKAAQQEAIDLGVSISSSAAKAADEFESNMTRIGAAVHGIFNKALEDALPVLQKITDQIIDFAKNANNTAPIVEQLAAGFKAVATAAIILGTGFEIVGKTIGGIIALIGFQIDALKDLALAFASPLEAAKNFIATEKLAYSALNDISKDVGNTAASGVKLAIDIWSGLGDAIKKTGEQQPKKPDLVLPDLTALKGIQAAIDALAKLDDTLKQQVATYGLSGAAATAYDVTLGKLSASVDEINKVSPSQAAAALAQLEKQGKLSKASIDEINTAIASGVPIGDAFKTAIINSADALDKLKGVDALSKLDSQLLTMTGHLEEARKAAFDLANRPLQITIQTAQDKTAFSGLDGSQKQLEVTTQINALNSQAIAIQDELAKKIADVDAAATAAGKGTLQIAGDEAVARQGAIAQLEALYVKAQALANATGLKSAVDEAQALRTALGNIQFNPKIVEDIDKATQEQQKFNEALRDEKKANDDLSLQLADLAKQNAQGSLTDLDYMAKQDTARQHEIDQLTTIQGQLLDIIKNNPGNAQALDDYKKLGVQIDGLQAQMGQLAKTIRTDLTDDLTNAFTDFATGAKSAKDALKEFVADFSKQMIELGAKQLFQKLFESTGISDGINSIFGGATKAASGIAGSSAAATSISTAMTTAATAGGATLGTGITTAATAGATELGTGITTAGTAAATEMGTAITTAGSAAAAEMAAAIAGASAAGSAAGAGIKGALIAATAATGGPIPSNQLTLVGEQGPELFVSDLGEQAAAAATKAGTIVPDDLTHSYIVGVTGPEYIRPNVSGFVVPSDVTQTGLASRTSDSSNVVDLVPLITARLPLAPHAPSAAEPALSTAILSPTALAALTPSDPTAAIPSAVPTGASVTAFTPPILLTGSSFSSFAPPVLNGASLQFAPVPAPPISLATIAPKIEAFAAGGSFTGGAPILVGENGPELIVPDVSGTVIPNNVIAQYIPQLSAVLDVTQPPQSPQAPLDPIPTYPTTTVNGAEVPLGLTDTFTTDAQGFTTINENVAGYAGMALPAGTVTASGATTLATSDLNFITVSQLAEGYEPDYLSQKYANTTMASYDAQFGSSTTPSTAPIRLGPTTGAPGLPGGTSTAINYAAELQSYANQKLSGNEAALPLAAYAGVGPVPASSSLIGTEAAAVQPNLLDARQYERLITDGYLEKRASGGPVSANTPYLVGEQGPELMVPDSDGTVMNSWDDSQSSRSTVVHQYLSFAISTPTGKVDRASQGQIAARVGMASQAAIGRNG